MFKKLLLTLFLLLFMQNVVMANVVKFVQVTDTHFKSDEPYRLEVLNAMVDTINKNEKDISFVMFTGDNIDKPDEKDLAIFVRTVNKLKKPYYIVIGHHDV